MKLIGGIIAPFVLFSVIIGVLNVFYEGLTIPKEEGGYYGFFKRKKIYEFILVGLAVIILISIYVFTSFSETNWNLISQSFENISNLL
jgi:hypothetical protein